MNIRSERLPPPPPPTFPLLGVLLGVRVTENSDVSRRPAPVSFGFYTNRINWNNCSIYSHETQHINKTRATSAFAITLSKVNLNFSNFPRINNKLKLAQAGTVTNVEEWNCREICSKKRKAFYSCFYMSSSIRKSTSERHNVVVHLQFGVELWQKQNTTTGNASIPFGIEISETSSDLALLELPQS